MITLATLLTFAPCSLSAILCRAATPRAPHFTGGHWSAATIAARRCWALHAERCDVLASLPLAPDVLARVLGWPVAPRSAVPSTQGAGRDLAPVLAARVVSGDAP